jgi:hypothetical protein
MKEKTKLRIILFFVIAYLIIFGILSISDKNYEFLYYSAIMALIIFIAIFYYKKLHLPISVITGFAIFGIMHMSGATFFVTLAVYSLLYPHFDKKLKGNKFLLFLLLILITLGIGAFHEILELGAVVFFDVSERVGDYMNNALDLLFNLIGAIVACIFLIIYHKREEKRILGIFKV